MTTFEQALAEFRAGTVSPGDFSAALERELLARPEAHDLLRQAVGEVIETLQLNTVECELVLAPFEKFPDPAEDDHTVVAVDKEYNVASRLKAPGIAGNGEDENADADVTRFASESLARAEPNDVASTIGPEGKSDSRQASRPAGDTETANNNRDGSAESNRSLRSGDVLNDQFQLEEVIGEGGMGVIFRAKDTLQEQFTARNVFVALKVLNESFSSHPDSVMALHRETRNAMSLSHDNIVRVHSFARDRIYGQYFMVMEYLRGEPLNHFIRRQNGKVLSFSEAWRICDGVGRALRYAHSKGIVHSDIKPGNIWLTDNNSVKVLDFGIARLTDPDPQTVWTGLDAHSPSYATKEMLRNEEPDKRDDIFALACVTYELLTAQHPYNKKDALEAERQGLVATRPRGLKNRQWQALRQALSLERDKCMESVDAFLKGLAPTSEKPKFVAALLAGLGVIGIVAGVLTNLDALGITTAPSNQADLFVNQIIALPPSRMTSMNLLEDDLAMGNFTVDEAREHFANEEFQLGNQKLKNGVTTAYRAYYSVIDGTDDPLQRRAAAEGILDVERTYLESVAALHEAGMSRKALWLACQGLSQPDGMSLPPWPPLVEHFEELWLEVKGSGPQTPAVGCVPSEIPESWGRTIAVRD